MKKFNVRVYGIWQNEQEDILLSDERIGDFRFTKFPGGGLEWGEGIRDCLIREWKEELDVDIEVGEHIYTTDFFQISAFDRVSQIISIYYRVMPKYAPAVEFKRQVFDFEESGEEETLFRWCLASEFNEDCVTLPIDKIVAKLLRKH